METIELLNKRLGELAAQAQTIANTAAAEQREPSDDEVTELEKINAAFASTEKRIKALEATAKMTATMTAPVARMTKPTDLPVNGETSATARPAMSITGGLPSGTTAGSWGFRGIGDWTVAASRTRRGQPDNRIVNAPSSYGSESQSADGGWLVPPDFRTQILKTAFAEDSLAGLCDAQVTSSNSITIPTDSTVPGDTAGVQVSWIGEGQAIPESKPSFGQLETKLNKLAAAVPVTSEMLEDAAQINGYLNSKVPEAITTALNRKILSGTGVGEPLGILKSGAKIIQDAEAAQGANTVVAKNVSKMYNRMIPQLRQQAVWIVKPDVEPQLQQMAMAGTSPAWPAYLPPGGLSATPYAQLLGRPVYASDWCSALGTEGDIIFWCPSRYLLATKSNGLRVDSSMHLYFSFDMTALRFVMRVGGQPEHSAAQVVNGGTSRSVIVTLNSSRT